MELRKIQHQCAEFKSLHEKLNDLGLYEKGMDLEQMRQVMGAVDESISETSFNEREIEFALKESEREFASANICNSTMIGAYENTNVLENQDAKRASWKGFSSPYSSPEVGCVQKMTVVAEVHRTHDWTPKKTSPSKDEKKRMPKKHDANVPPHDDSGIILSSSNSLFETTSL